MKVFFYILVTCFFVLFWSTEISDLKNTILFSKKVSSGVINERKEKDEVGDDGFLKKGDSINLRSFGVYGNGKDETKKIQVALNNCVGKTLYIPKQEGVYYLIKQLIIPNNIKIVCESSVVFMGSDDLNQNIENFEVMFRFENSENVIFDGHGALFKMNKLMYKNEHNHIFMINGAQNVNLINLRIEDAGGDGIYVGAVRCEKKYSKNISIVNSKVSNCRRQGLSIISVDGLLVKKCSFNSSNGASPESGIDIEPSNYKCVLKNIKIVDSKATGNKKRGFLINLNRLNKNSEIVDIIFENCVAVKNMEGFSNRQFREVQGKIEFKNCISRKSKVTGFTESSCLANSVQKIYNNCVVEDSNTRGIKMDNYLFKSGFYLAGSKIDKVEVIGNSQFINCKSIITKGSSGIDYGLVIDNKENDIGSIYIKNFIIEGGHKDKLHFNNKVKKYIRIN